MTIKDWQAKYENFVLNTTSRATAVRYSVALSNFFHRFPEKKKPENFFRLDIEDYKILRKRDGISPRTINYEVGVVRSFWNWLIEMSGQPYLNPASRVKRLREPQPPKRALEFSTLEAILQACDTTQERLLVLLGSTTGLRGAELCALEFVHIDSEQGLLTLPAQLTKTQSGRVVPLREDVLALLQLQQRATQASRVFEGFAQTPQAIRYRWNRLLHRAGFQGIGLHSLRHTFLTQLLRQGLDVASVAALAGHASVATTLGYLAPAKADEARKFLEHLPRLKQSTVEGSLNNL
jgi:integrase